MGQGKSQFSEAELEDYQDLTYFTKKEILYAHNHFQKLAPEKVGHNPNAKLPMDKLLTLPELRANPFADRICQVFSSSKDGDCTFEDFLDMMSVFSEAAPKTVKTAYAFRIYDFDGDEYLDRSDLTQVVCRLIGGRHVTEPSQLVADLRMSSSDVDILVSKILEEADLDDDGRLAYAEFDHVMSKAPDFANSFLIRL
ncbi:calcium and integrin-binding protein 1 [Hyalella azteca]|uniref:Calcium and integrin-binding protein 1 n=1 Tax=Hyalella azteca TaxID=294128 RepID=A0A8B7NJI8_HYAAZ|nr:calcium and integrin-binding protein 1 [Hyalella azteca]